MSVMFRGEPRFTADVDVVALLDVEGALALLGDLAGTPFMPMFDGAQDVVRTAFVLPLRHRETTIAVDCALALSGFERQVIERATPVPVGRTALPAASPEDLVLLKLIAGRPRDMEDARGIVLRGGRALKWDDLERTAALLQSALAQDLVPQMSPDGS